MTETFIIGTAIGEWEEGNYLQDSLFGRKKIEYILRNYQPTNDYTQSMGDKRINFAQNTSNGEIIIVHYN